jgi:hypothetical protein
MPNNHKCKSLEEATREYRTSARDLGYPHAFPVPNTRRLHIVLAGDDFDEVETKLATDGSDLQSVLADCRQRHRATPYPGMVWHAIWRAAKSVNADIILLDFAPAVNALNKNMLMHCDYFITPCLPDQFSQKGLERLGLSLGKWYREFEPTKGGQPHPPYAQGLRQASRGVNQGGKLPAEYPLPSMRPQFAGCIISGYNPKPTCVLTDIKLNGGAPHIEEPNGHAAQLLSSKIMRRAEQVAEALTPRLPGGGLPALGGGGAGAAAAAAGGGGGAAAAAGPSHEAKSNAFAVPVAHFPHPKGGNLYPQPHVLARIRKGISGFEHATINFGKPFAFLTDKDLTNAPDGLNLRNSAEMKEHVAHFQRIYVDMARFLASLPLDHNSDDQGRFKFNMPQENGRDEQEEDMAFD